VKWLALLGVIVAAGAAVLFMRGSPAPPPQPSVTASLPASRPAAPALPPAPALAPVPASAPVARAPGPWQRIELRGVLFQQNNPAASQALLSQDGQRAQVFHSGEQVLPGWTLQSIASDHVIVAQGAEHHRLDVVQAPSAPSAAAPAQTPRIAAASATNPVTLPGFIPAPPGQRIAAPPSLETNRRFLQDRRNRAASAAR